MDAYDYVDKHVAELKQKLRHENNHPCYASMFGVLKAELGLILTMVEAKDSDLYKRSLKYLDAGHLNMEV